MNLESLLDQPNKLPIIPKVVQQLIASFAREDVALGEIARLLATDPALSAKLLRLANSAYFHVSRTIGTVDDAVRMLGLVMVRNLVLGNSMVAAFRHTPGLDLSQFWRYNLYTVGAARWLAGTAGANADLAFTVGLMHGIGQLQMHAVAPAAMAPLDRQMNVLAAGRAELEQQAFGFHHGDVAAALAQLWHFPQPIVAALRAVPHPLRAEEFSAGPPQGSEPHGGQPREGKLAPSGGSAAREAASVGARFSAGPSQGSEPHGGQPREGELAPSGGSAAREAASVGARFSEPAAWVHLAAWRARAEVLAQTDDEALAIYPRELGRRLGLAPAWTPALAAQAANLLTCPLMPALSELSAGLEAMLE